MTKKYLQLYFGQLTIIIHSNYLNMTLEKYWEILAGRSACSSKITFFDNGFLAVKTLQESILYDKNGWVFDIGEKTLCCDNGTIATLPFEKTKDWFITNLKKEPVEQLSRICKVYQNGYYSYTLVGETFYSNYIRQRFSLGYGVINIITGPNGAFAYQQKVRRYTYWYMCQIKRGKLLKSDALVGVNNISFFANGSYVVYYNNGNIHVFNNRGEKIFACNSKQTSFCKVGRNAFCATNGKKYKGIYSAEDGKLVLENDAIYSYWDNGAFYLFEENLLYLPKSKCYLRLKDIHDYNSIGKSLFYFHHENRLFVIDTNLSVEELRKKVINALHKHSDNDTYSAYLANLLTLLY